VWQGRRTSASEERDGRLRVDNGPTVEPKADVHANDRLRRMNSAADGQQQPVSLAGQIARKQSFAVVLFR